MSNPDFERYMKKVRQESAGREADKQRRFHTALAGNEHFRVLQMHRSVEFGGRPYPALLTYPGTQMAYVPMENGTIAQVTHWGTPKGEYSGTFGIRRDTGGWENHTAESLHNRLQELSREQRSPQELESNRVEMTWMRHQAERDPTGYDEFN